MYYEIAKVKTYFRTYKNKKVPYNQLHLGKAEDSKFNEDPKKPDEVAVIKLLELNELVEKAKPTELNELKAKLNELQKEKLQLEEELKKVKATNGTLASDVNELKEEKIQLQEEKAKLQEDLLTEKDKNENVIELEKYEAKVEELSKEKDLTKSLLLVRSDFLKQGRIKSFLKIEPESSKIIGNIKGLPDIEVKSKPSEEDE